MSDALPLPLPALYARASRANAPIDVVLEFSDAVRRAGVISVDSESADDVCTSSLKYVLRERLLGDAYARRHAEGDVRRACEAYEGFIDTVTKLELAPKDERACMEEMFGESRTSTSEDANAGRGSRDVRADKVRRFRRKKDVDERIRDIARARAMKDDVESDEDKDEGDDDEALEREFWLLSIERAVIETLDEFPTLRMECEMLARREELEESAAVMAKKAQTAENASLPRELLDAVSSLSTAPSSSTVMREIDPRTRFAREVFRPSHILPTMTVEQAGEIEFADMMDRQRREQEREAERERVRASKTEEELEDEELYRAREWDAFKDDNPYGSGNSKLRPCG